MMCGVVTCLALICLPNSLRTHTHTHTHTTVLLLFWNMSRTTLVSRYQKGKTRQVKTNLDLLEQEIVSGSGICWAICSLHLNPDNHANIPPLSFLQAGCPSCRPTNSVKALKAKSTEGKLPNSSFSSFSLQEAQYTVQYTVHSACNYW